MNYAIFYIKPGTTLAFWLNKFHAGGFIWSLVRTHVSDTDSTQRWNQPALRFDSEDSARAFIASQLGNNPDARVTRVND